MEVNDLKGKPPDREERFGKGSEIFCFRKERRNLITQGQGSYLVVQWLRLLLAMQRMHVHPWLGN